MLLGKSMALFVSCSSGGTVSSLKMVQTFKRNSDNVFRYTQQKCPVDRVSFARYPAIWQTRHHTSVHALSKDRPRPRRLRISHTALCARKSRAVPNRFC